MIYITKHFPISTRETPRNTIAYGQHELHSLLLELFISEYVIVFMIDAKKLHNKKYNIVLRVIF